LAIIGDPDDPIENFRFFYMIDGNLHSYDMQERDLPYRYVAFSENYYLVEFFGDEGYIEFIIHLFTEGETVPVEVILISYPDWETIGDDWDNWWEYTPLYEYNGNLVSESEFEGYRRQYGVEGFLYLSDSPDDTAKILALTTFEAVSNQNG